MIPIYVRKKLKKALRHLLGEGDRSLFLLGIILILSSAASAQVDSASVSGVITDETGGIVVGAEVRVTNADTNLTSTTTSNQSGVYLVTGLRPGRYRVHIAKDGFKGIDLTDLILNVQDSVSRNFTLQVGSMSESISVEAGRLVINTTDGSVSTMVDSKYVENMPLNGRSLQDLILLTPGIVTNSPQFGPTGPPAVGKTGEFSVNGQRTESNYYTVDGVSANVGVFPGDRFGPGNSGSVPAGTALGTTQSLVSVDSLQEFRVQSSTYSAEYGRNPGGQFSFLTRSGTNEWHGTAFDYLRNDYFDANNWFNNFLGKAEPPLRQNDFGGTVGAPIEIPHIYNGKNKTFFFFSYEGLRLLQPQAANITYVPDAALRQTAPASFQAVLNAFPIPNGPEALATCNPATDPTCPPSGQKPTGKAQFIGSWSNPSSIDAYSIRLDHSIGERLRVFFRFSDAPSTGNTRLTGGGGTPSITEGFKFTLRSYTFGATSAFSAHFGNEFRLNYGSNLSELADAMDNFGGAQPVNLAQLQQINSSEYDVEVGLPFGAFASGLIQKHVTGLQRQWNLTDSVIRSVGRHQLKAGVDYRRIAPIQKAGLRVTYSYRNQTQVNNNNPANAIGFNFSDVSPLYTNFSAFVQDEWKMSARLSLSMGLRWEVNPAPGVTSGILPFTVVGSSLATLALAPQGTPLWETGWHNIAPRVGAAYLLRNTPKYQTVLRGGFGLFYDTGQQLASDAFAGPGFANVSPIGPPRSFPIPPAQLPPPASTAPTPPYSATGFAFPTHYQLPYTLHWNVAVEQAFGDSQALSVTYVGSHAARLLQTKMVDVTAVNPAFPRQVDFFPNGLTSDYDALQVQLRRNFSRGLAALASYTFSHSIDYGSQNASLPYIRGNSDFDVRHNFSAAFSYDFAKVFHGRVPRAFFHHWGLDDRFSARTGFPVTLNGNQLTDPVTGQVFFGGLDLVPGVPLYQSGSAYPGGRRINPAAFSFPAAANQVGNAPRNFVRGFGAWQMDIAIRREFPIYERLKLQFRAEAFNVFNHPNFGYIDPFLDDPTFGQAMQALNTSLGTLSPLYQMGGPRSMQFALKLIF